MSEQDHPDEGEDQPETETPSLLVKAYIDQQIKNAIKQQEEAQHHKKKWRNSWRSASPITKASVILTAAVAASTIAYAYIAWRQLGAMRKISEDNAAQTEKLIEAANEMKSAAWTFSGAAIGINNANWNAVNQLNAQEKSLEASRHSSEEAAQKYLQTTIDNFRLEQLTCPRFLNH